jgi:hypothetical protein
MTDGDAPQFAYGCYPKADIFKAPHLIEALTSERVLDICEGYLGARPMLFSLNVYWSFPGHAASAAAQDYHRDIDHPRFCVLFVYLNDVEEHNGPHEFIVGTHDVDRARQFLEANGQDYTAEELFALPGDGYGQESLYRRLFGDQILTIAGPAGTAFIEDTYGLHRGRPPQHAPRLAAWARYTRFPSPPSLDPVSMSILGDRYPSDERRQYAIRALVQQ